MPVASSKRVHREGFLAALGLSGSQSSIIVDLLDSIPPQRVVELDQKIFDPLEFCPIPWRPTIFTPVFWGKVASNQTRTFQSH
jgi:hypothetical protein